MIKPNTLKELFNQLRQNFKNVVGFYEIFYVGKNKKVTKIYTNEDYKIVDDILFVREVESKYFKPSSSGINKDLKILLALSLSTVSFKINVRSYLLITSSSMLIWSFKSVYLSSTLVNLAIESL